MPSTHVAHGRHTVLCDAVHCWDVYDPAVHVAHGVHIVLVVSPQGWPTNVRAGHTAHVRHWRSLVTVAGVSSYCGAGPVYVHAVVLAQMRSEVSVDSFNMYWSGKRHTVTKSQTRSDVGVGATLS